MLMYKFIHNLFTVWHFHIFLFYKMDKLRANNMAFKIHSLLYFLYLG